jgi:hypothetical protein
MNNSFFHILVSRNFYAKIIELYISNEYKRLWGQNKDLKKPIQWHSQWADEHVRFLEYLVLFLPCRKLIELRLYKVCRIFSGHIALTCLHSFPPSI